MESETIEILPQRQKKTRKPAAAASSTEDDLEASTAVVEDAKIDDVAVEAPVETVATQEHPTENSAAAADSVANNNNNNHRNNNFNKRPSRNPYVNNNNNDGNNKNYNNNNNKNYNNNNRTRNPYVPITRTMGTIRYLTTDPFMPEYYSSRFPEEGRIANIPVVEPPDLEQYFEKKGLLENKLAAVETELNVAQAAVNAFVDLRDEVKSNNPKSIAQELHKKFLDAFEERKKLQAVLEHKREEFKTIVAELNENGGLVRPDALHARIAHMQTEMETDSGDHSFNLTSLARPNISKTGLIKLKKSSHLTAEKTKLDEITRLRQRIPQLEENQHRIDRAKAEIQELSVQVKELKSTMSSLREQEVEVQKSIDDQALATSSQKSQLKKAINERNAARSKVFEVRDELWKLMKAKEKSVREYELNQALAELRSFRGDQTVYEEMRKTLYANYGYEMRQKRRKEAAERAEKEAQELEAKEAKRLLKLAKKKASKKQPNGSPKAGDDHDEDEGEEMGKAEDIILDQKQFKEEAEALEILRLQEEAKKKEREERKFQEDQARQMNLERKQAEEEEEAERKAVEEAVKYAAELESKRKQEVDEDFQKARLEMIRKRMEKAAAKTNSNNNNNNKGSSPKSPSEVENNTNNKKSKRQSKQKKSAAGASASAENDDVDATVKARSNVRTDSEVQLAPKTAPEIKAAKMKADEQRELNAKKVLEITRNAYQQDDSSNIWIFVLVAILVLLILAFVFGNVYGRAPAQSIPIKTFGDEDGDDE